MIGGAASRLGRAAESTTVMTDNDRIPRVLVVDDEPNIRELVQVALKFHGCAVSTAASGTEAIRQAENLRPDLIVLDVVMPDLDGFEVCRRLRAMGNEVPVIFLTARDTSSDTVTGLRSEATTTSPSRSRWRRWWPGSGRCCAVHRGPAPAGTPRPARRCGWVTWSWTSHGGRCKGR